MIETGGAAPISGAAPPSSALVAARRHRRLRFGVVMALLALALVGSGIVAVTFGPASLSVVEVWSIVLDHLGGPSSGQTVLRDHIVWELRLPRVLLAVIVGGGLAVIGAVMQTLTRNPLADPYLLGISSGAGLGAVMVLVVRVGGGIGSLTAGAFLGAVGAFSLVLLFGRHRGRLTPTRMVLAGVAIAQACGAATSIIVIWVNDPHATQSLTFWLSGSLASARWSTVGLGAAALVGVLVLYVWAGRALDGFAFGEDAAASLGIEVDRLRWVLLVATALLTGTLVAVSGAIGFVGLILPHAVRFVVGSHHHRVLPAAALVGALFLVWIDTIARTAFAPRELPVGVLTAVVGVPAFIVLLRRAEVRR